jgi:hypothetical protein
MLCAECLPSVTLFVNSEIFSRWFSEESMLKRLRNVSINDSLSNVRPNTIT